LFKLSLEASWNYNQGMTGKLTGKPIRA